MVHKITSMTPSEMESVCRSMTDSFMDYEMTGSNMGMLEHLDREHFYYMVRSYLELAIRNGSLYCAGDNGEGYFVFETPETKSSLSGSLLQAKWMLKAFGIKKGIQYIKEITNSGPFLPSEFKKAKKPFSKIEIVAVAKEYQGQGYMRKMMDYAISESERLGIPLHLTTDDARKVRMYEHFGMKMVREHVVSKSATYYEMFKGKEGIA